MRKFDRLLELVLTFALAGLTGCNTLPAGPGSDGAEARNLISLNGTWEIAEGAMESIPTEFAVRVPVPGLVDMAEPAFAEVGTKSNSARRSGTGERSR